MAETSRPWSGTVTGDAGPYSDDQWTDVWKTLLGPDVATDGVFWDQLNELVLGGLAATPISIGTGRALVDGSWYQTDAALSFAIGSPAVNPRIDRIVLRKDWALQTIRAAVITGAEAAPPVPPAITQIDGTTWDLPLWQIHITTGGVITIYADEREWIGQMEPVGVTLTQVYLDEEFYFGSDLATGDQLNSFEASILNTTIGPLTLAGFGSGAVRFAHDGGGVGRTAQLVSRIYKPDLIDARTRMRLKSPNTDANLDVVVGYSVDYADLTPNDGVFFRADSAGNWFAVCRTAAVETAVDTGQAQDDVWREFQIRQTSTDVVEFLIDAVVVATIQANIPSDVALLLGFGIFDDGGAVAAADYLHVDTTKLTGIR